MNTPDFRSLFVELAGSEPFPWQTALFIRFIEGPSLPGAADIPTGLGKTSVVVIWLIALLLFPEKVARRLVYVVNRRTVVDQTTAEVERLREKLRQNPVLLEKLNALCAVPTDEPLALSTLRGQFADNRAWCADPCRPAVIVGTVDMIGSGLLFSRYTCGFRTRPHHAAFLGQDVLLVHDEAHLEPAFQRLLESIVKEQARCRDAKPVHVLQLTATTRGGEAPFILTPEDERHEKVIERLKAPKRLELTPITDEKAELALKLIELALGRRESGRAVLIFARTVEVVQKVAAALEAQKQKCEVLTGTMRGKERESLIRKGVFARFLPASSRPEGAEALAEGTCYLVATSAGEVGVNISAADLICDLSTYESMAQRFGRVNRFGEFKGDDASTITVVHPEEIKNPEPGEKGHNPVEAARSRTLDLLRQLNGAACPQALRQLKQRLGPEKILDAFTPAPPFRDTTDILFDAWAMTSIREAFPGRPPIAPYLHGEEEPEAAETQVAWRSEVEIIKGGLEEIYRPEELLSEFPLKPHELLRGQSSRVRAELQKTADRLGENAAKETRLWVVANDGTVRRVITSDGELRFPSLDYLTDKDHEDMLHDATLLLPPSLGGLSSAGLLDGKAIPPESAEALDVAEVFTEPDRRPLRIRIRRDDPEDIPVGFAVKVVIDTEITVEDASANADDETTSRKARYWLWLEAASDSGTDSTQSKDAVLLDAHVADVVAHATNIATKLALPESLRRCVILAARIHDLGKRRRHWQRGIGNHDPAVCYAKSGKLPGTTKRLRPRPGLDPYRHEFGSLLDVEISERLQRQNATIQEEFTALSTDEKDIVLHLVAAHHGRARPHFPTAPADETFDPDAGYDEALSVAAEAPQRFARLQRRFGRWGLAYLESLLRAADYAASAGIPPLNVKSHE
jgi:CRISPR-associated endonuclease/helicase Cas3